MENKTSLEGSRNIILGSTQQNYHIYIYIYKLDLNNLKVVAVIIAETSIVKTFVYKYFQRNF